MRTTRSGHRYPWRQARFLLYLLVVAGLFLARGGIRWGNLIPSSPTGAGDTLRVAGRDLAPGLVDRMIELYRRDYPDLHIVVRGGGTNHALEDLVNGEADVAFLVRPPGTEEQGLFRTVFGDSVLWFPVALGGIALLAGPDSDPAPILLPGLWSSLVLGASFRFDRVYVPDPNQGLWDVLRDSLGGPAGDPAPGGRIVFLRDEAEVLSALRSDPGALGVASTLALPEPLPSGVAMARVGGESSQEAVLPTYESIGLGEYPLVHALYVSCRSGGDIQGAKFVTLLTSGPGQRRVERAGYVPALRYLREVVLTTHPLGK